MTAETLHIDAGADPDLAQVARVLRTAASVHSETGPLNIHMPATLARRIAHHLDGGGFIDAAEAVALLMQRDRDGWAAKCQGMMDEARRDKFDARMTLGLALALYAFGAALVFWA